MQFANKRSDNCVSTVVVPCINLMLFRWTTFHTQLIRRNATKTLFSYCSLSLDMCVYISYVSSRTKFHVLKRILLRTIYSSHSNVSAALAMCERVKRTTTHNCSHCKQTSSCLSVWRFVECKYKYYIENVCFKARTHHCQIEMFEWMFKREKYLSVARFI